MPFGRHDTVAQSMTSLNPAATSLKLGVSTETSDVVLDTIRAVGPSNPATPITTSVASLPTQFTQQCDNQSGGLPGLSKNLAADVAALDLPYDTTFSAVLPTPCVTNP